jgi:hypothetical protein
LAGVSWGDRLGRRRSGISAVRCPCCLLKGEQGKKGCRLQSGASAQASCWSFLSAARNSTSSTAPLAPSCIATHSATSRYVHFSTNSVSPYSVSIRAVLCLEGLLTLPERATQIPNQNLAAQCCQDSVVFKDKGEGRRYTH